MCHTGLFWHLKKHHKVCYWLGGRWRGGGRARGKGAGCVILAFFGTSRSSIRSAIGWEVAGGGGGRARGKGGCRTGLFWHLKKHKKHWRGGGHARGKGGVSYWPSLAPQETP